jgi:hypothetical protein
VHLRQALQLVLVGDEVVDRDRERRLGLQLLDLLDVVEEVEN